MNTVLLLGKAQQARPATQICSKVSEEINEGARLGFIVVCGSQYPGERTAVTNVTLKLLWLLSPQRMSGAESETVSFYSLCSAALTRRLYEAGIFHNYNRKFFVLQVLYCILKHTLFGNLVRCQTNRAKVFFYINFTVKTKL